MDQEKNSPIVLADQPDLNAVAFHIEAMVKDWYEADWKDHHLPAHLIERRLSRFFTPQPERDPTNPFAPTEQYAENAKCSAHQQDMGDGRVLTSETPIPQPEAATPTAQGAVTPALSCPLCGNDACLSDLDDEDDRRIWTRKIECHDCGLVLKDGISWGEYSRLGKDKASERVGQMLRAKWTRHPPRPSETVAEDRIICLPHPMQEFGVCVGGRFDGWLMWRHPDGCWISREKLADADPAKELPAALRALKGGA